MKLAFSYLGKLHTVDVQTGRQGYKAEVGGKEHVIRAEQAGNGELQLEIEGTDHRVLWAKDGREIWVHLDGKSYHLEKVTAAGAASTAAHAERILRAPMPGLVRQVLVQSGQEVKAGETLLLLEAMKMEIRIQAPQPGILAQVAVKQGQTVEKEQMLIEFED